MNNNVTLIGKTRPKEGSPSSPIWKMGQYAQGYDLPRSRGGIVIEEIPCPICHEGGSLDHNATVEMHWLGGLGKAKHICCDNSGIWWREI